MIPYGRQDITESDISEVEKVLRSNFLTQGPIVPKFEKSVSNYCGASYAVSVNSATSALHIACLALDLGPGDCLWTVPNTFVASANCGRYCGASIDFVDIYPKTYNMSISALSDKLLKWLLERPEKRILCVTHYNVIKNILGGVGEINNTKIFTCFNLIEIILLILVEILIYFITIFILSYRYTI